MKEPENHAASSDPLIDEVRNLKKALCDSHHNDVDRLWEHLQEVQRQYQGRLVASPRRQPLGSGP